MITTTSNFDAKHGLNYKTPVYSVCFHQGPTTFPFVFSFTFGPESEENGFYFSNKEVAQIMLDEGGSTITDEDGNAIDCSPIHYKLLKNISGIKQTVTPDKGQASISGVTATLVDQDNIITSMFSYDSVANLHRTKVSVKAGYKGLSFSDYPTIFTGWATGCKMSSDLGNYVFTITDPQKWLQKYVARSATSDAPVYYQGNPINIILQILLSTGEKSNGVYDFRSAANGCGIDQDYVDVAGLEAIRDRYYPGDSHYLRIIVTERIKAKDLIEKEILKVLNCYPKIDGNGRYSIVPFDRPIIPDDVVTFDKDNIIGMPAWSANWESLKNEIEFSHDYDVTENDFEEITYYADADSINARGQGNEQITIESHGLHLSHSPSSVQSRAETIISRRKQVAFDRWKEPPIKVTIKTLFLMWHVEAGDIVYLTHPDLPDIAVGTKGVTQKPMEVLSRSVDWKNGRVNFELLDTGFGQGTTLDELVA